MAYVPTEWKTGDIVTAERLNKMEEGIASSGVLIVHRQGSVLDKTWKQIHDAGCAMLEITDVQSGIVMEMERIYISTGFREEENRVYFVTGYNHDKNKKYQFTTTNENGYPGMTM